MARPVSGFLKDQVEGPRRYPWHEWTDGQVWEIRYQEDYDIPTENMRVNLHERAKQGGLMRVRTEKIKDRRGEGLRFQFTRPDIPSPIVTPIAHRGRDPWQPQSQRTMPTT